ncbi:hypothetical protein HHX47_DHR4000719 [Lentinula edodes]|nr:hypothetical protein HHX47_DHR4000719 [Lentinula edodes]
MSSWRFSENPSNSRGYDRGFRGRGRASWSSQGRGASTLNTGNRRLENIASVSRSSGVEKDGDACTTLTSISVCETSLYIATLFNHPKQLSSILPYFIPHPSDSTAEVLSQQSYSMCAIFIALINQLILGYPSQTLYRQSIHSIPDLLLRRSSRSHRWISSLSSSLWANNFSKSEQLTRRSSITSLLDELLPDSLSAHFTDLSLSSHSSKSNRDIARKAFFHAVDMLRVKIRNSAWNIIRSSYRELSCNANSETRDWLNRSLSLTVAHSEDTCDSSLDVWLKEKSAAGHIRSKEGVEGRWVFCKK